MTMCLMGRSNHPVDLLGNTVSDDDVANDIVVTWPYKTEMTTLVGYNLCREQYPHECQQERLDEPLWFGVAKILESTMLLIQSDNDEVPNDFGYTRTLHYSRGSLATKLYRKVNIYHLFFLGESFTF